MVSSSASADSKSWSCRTCQRHDFRLIGSDRRRKLTAATASPSGRSSCRTSQASRPCSSRTRTRVADATPSDCADERRAVVGEAHSIAPAEHRERAQRVEPSGQRAGRAPRRDGRRRGAARERGVSRDEPRLRRRRVGGAGSRASSRRSSAAQRRASPSATRLRRRRAAGTPPRRRAAPRLATRVWHRDEAAPRRSWWTSARAAADALPQRARAPLLEHGRCGAGARPCGRRRSRRRSTASRRARRRRSRRW